MVTKATDELSNLKFEEISLFNERKNELLKEQNEYLSRHPEINTLLNTFLSAVLMDKPNDIIEFARDHFSALAPSQENEKILPLIIAGPSGVGKGSLINKLLSTYPKVFDFSVSHTTRLPRSGETEGISYHFTKMEDMAKDIENGFFLEYAHVHGNTYGTSKSSVEAVQKKGKICILDIDIQGVQQVKKSVIQAKYIFISPPSIEELEKRLINRGSETPDKIAIRLRNAKDEIEFSKINGNFDKIIINKDLDIAFNELKQVIKTWYPHLTEL